MTVPLDLLLYVSLLVLFLWRTLCPWRCCGYWLELLNYCSLLYVLMHVLLICEVVSMVKAALADLNGPYNKEIDASSILWLKVLLWSTPVALLTILLLSWSQTRQHIVKLRQRQAELQHDRAVQIIALPAVYGLMALSALTQLYRLACQQHIDDTSSQIVLAQYDTVYLVGDLYEAWALYQFGKLTLEVLGATLAQRLERNGGNDTEHILLSYTAVSSLMWLGTALFVVVCVIEAGWSLWQWTFADAVNNFEEYETGAKQFTYADLLASAAAIYNVHTVEHTYAPLIESYSPTLKFLSVKMLVFFCFWQYRSLQVAQYFGVLQLTDMQVKLFHSTLLVYECLLSALVHRWAWSADEEWYNMAMKTPTEAVEDGSAATGERRPLLSGSAAV